MTAKEYLEQGLNIEKLITENTRLLEYWRDRSTHISGSNFEPKYNASKSTSASFVSCVEKILLYEENTKRNIDKLYELKNEIYTSIQQLTNQMERLILMYRYVDCHTWPEISTLMGLSERTVCRVHNEALKKFKVPVINCPALA